VPKVLVADDNSNIQKMVALILKDEGIEVTAVGNGEAAVRRLPDLLPDIVLADVFMPVRSGYEVCEYIKKDPRFLHIPVVLLLGAFDPLDETETKRVGADGVLKKPFVPPDPLLTLVRGLLEKSAPGNLVPAAVPAEAERTVAQAKPATRIAPLPATFQGEAEEGEFVAMGREALDTVGAQGAGQANARATSTEEEDTAVTQQRDSSLGEPAFWRPLEPEEAALGDTVVENAAEPNWGTAKQHGDQFEGLQELESKAETHAESELVTPALVEEVPETLHVEVGKAPGLAANPEEWLEAELKRPPHPGTEFEPPSGDSQAAESAEDSASSEAPAKLIEFAPPPIAPAEPEESAAPETLEAFEPLTPESFEPPQAHQEEVTSPSRMALEELPSLADLGPALEHLRAGKAPKPTEEAKPQAPATSAPAAAPAGRTVEPELIEAVVGRVMAKLQPQVIEIITREVLRPIVEALVRREIDKP